MYIFIDNRETSLYTKCLELLPQFPQTHIQMKVLPLGDISICKDEAGLDEILLIERKSLNDLLSSIKDGRYEEQSYRLTNASQLPRHRILYIVEGIFHQLRTPQDKKLIMSSVISLNLFKGFSVYRTSSVLESAEWILSIASKIKKDLAKGRVLYNGVMPPFSTLKQNEIQPMGEEHPTEGGVATTLLNNSTMVEDIFHNTNEINTIDNTNLVETSPAHYSSVVKKVKKDNITPDNIGEILLCQIPSISSHLAIEIMKVYGTFPNMIRELSISTQKLESLKITSNGKSRKIPKNVVENIKKYLLETPISG